MSAGQNKIGLGTAIIVGMNAMIGVGIIAVPSLLAVRTGPAGIFTFMFCIGAVILIGLSLGDLAHRYPGDGWNYLYPSKWGGHILGMIAAFSYFLGVVIAMGFLVQYVGMNLYSFIPILSPITLGVATLVLLTLLIVAGTEISAWGQYVIIICVLTPLIFTSLLCWWHFNIDYATPFIPYGIRSIFEAAPRALFGLLGFESIVSLYAVVKDPGRNVPLAAVFSVLFIGIFYIFFSSAIIFSIPPEFFAGGVHVPLGQILLRAFPQYWMLGYLVGIGVLFGILGTLHSMIWSLSVLLTSLLKRAKSTSIVRMLKENRWNDNFSVGVVFSLILFFALTGYAEMLINMTALFIVPSYIMSVMALLFIKEKWGSGHNLITVGALATSFIMLYYAAMPVLDLLANFFI